MLLYDSIWGSNLTIISIWSPANQIDLLDDFLCSLIYIACRVFLYNFWCIGLFGCENSKLKYILVLFDLILGAIQFGIRGGGVGCWALSLAPGQDICYYVLEEFMRISYTNFAGSNLWQQIQAFFHLSLTPFHRSSSFLCQFCLWLC